MQLQQQQKEILLGNIISHRHIMKNIFKGAFLAVCIFTSICFKAILYSYYSMV